MHGTMPADRHRAVLDERAVVVPLAQFHVQEPDVRPPPEQFGQGLLRGSVPVNGRQRPEGHPGLAFLFVCRGRQVVENLPAVLLGVGQKVAHQDERGPGPDGDTVEVRQFHDVAFHRHEGHADPDQRPGASPMSPIEEPDILQDRREVQTTADYLVCLRIGSIHGNRELVQPRRGKFIHQG